MIKCFIDTEFTDFIDAELISFGAVTTDGREFYVEITDYNPNMCSGFVKEHVLPLLNQPNPVKRLTYHQACLALGNWIEDLSDDVEIMIDYKTDWDFLEAMINDLWPKNLINLPTMIYGDIQRSCVSKIGKRDAAILCAGEIFDEEKHGMALGTALGEYHKIFHHAFLEHFFIAQQCQPNYKQHHALFDARANLAGWKAAMSFVESL